MKIYESHDGQHWKDTHVFRPFNRMTRGDCAWFVLGHILLAPLAILVLVLSVLALPLFKLWSWWHYRHPTEIDVHGEVKNILKRAEPGAVFTGGFVDGIRPEVTPDISIVIPFYNRATYVHKSIASLLIQSLPERTTVEIIAVDNGSTDNTLEILKNYPVRIVHCGVRGPGAARNAGIEAARGRIVAFTDSDCVVDSYWIRNLSEAFKDPDVLVAGGRILSLMADDFVASFTNDMQLLDNARFFEGSGYFPPFFATANAAYRRDALLEVGGFDNKLWMSEDADLTWRVLELGGKIAYMEDAVIYHEHRSTLKGLASQAIDYGAASVAIFAKHRDNLEARAAFSWKNLRDIAWSPFGIIWDQFAAEDSNERKRELFYVLWRLGFTWGSVRECIRRRVFFL